MTTMLDLSEYCSMIPIAVIINKICSKIKEAITKGQGLNVFNEPQHHFNATIIEIDPLLISIFVAEYAR